MFCRLLIDSSVPFSSTVYVKKCDIRSIDNSFFRFLAFYNISLRKFNNYFRMFLSAMVKGPVLLDQNVVYHGNHLSCSRVHVKKVDPSTNNLVK